MEKAEMEGMSKDGRQNSEDGRTAEHPSYSLPLRVDRIPELDGISPL